MKRKLEILVPAVLLSAVLVLGMAAFAVAAASPSVTTGTHSHVTDTSAELQGTINPNGNSTAYYFEWGLTTAYGVTSVEHSAGHGTKPVAVSTTASDLIPGTVYHYRLVAANGSGSATGRGPDLQDRRQSTPGRVHRTRDADRQERRDADRGGQPQQAGHDLLLPVRPVDRLRLADDRRGGSGRNRAGDRDRERSGPRGADDLPLPDRRAARQHRPAARRRRDVHDAPAPPARAANPRPDEAVSATRPSRTCSPPPDRCRDRPGFRRSTTAAGTCRSGTSVARTGSGRRWCRSDRTASSRARPCSTSFPAAMHRWRSPWWPTTSGTST